MKNPWLKTAWIIVATFSVGLYMAWRTPCITVIETGIYADYPGGKEIIFKTSQGLIRLRCEDGELRYYYCTSDSQLWLNVTNECITTTLHGAYQRYEEEYGP